MENMSSATMRYIQDRQGDYNPASQVPVNYVNNSNVTVPIINKQPTRDAFVNESASQKTDTKKQSKKKKALIIGGILVGAAAIAGIIYAVKKGKADKVKDVADKASKQLSDIKFDGGIASLKGSGEKFTGTLNHTLKNGDKVVMEYTDGVLQNSTRSGSKNFEKIYKVVNGERIVEKIENNTTKKTNITQIQNEVKKAQNNFKKLLEKPEELSDWGLQNYDKKYLNKNQKVELENIIKERTAAKEAAEKAKNATEDVVKKAEGTVSETFAKAVESEAYTKEISPMCKIEAKDKESYDAAKKTIEEVRKSQVSFLENQAKKGYVEEADLDLVKKYKDCTYDNIDILFEQNGDKPVDKLYLLARGNLEKSGSSVLVYEVPEIFQGLEPAEIGKSIDKMALSSDGKMIDICGKKFNYEVIGGGTYNKVAKISDQNGKSVVLRIASSANAERSACEEIVNSLNLTKNNIADVPRFYMGNPISTKTYTGNYAHKTQGCWQLCEYVTPETPVRKNGKRLFEYLEENGGRHTDLNSGSMVGNYIVDYGGISGPNMGGFSRLLNTCGLFQDCSELTTDEILKIVKNNMK